MAKLSAEEIARVARAAGVPRDQAVKAVAIALAESGGNPQAHNAVPPDNSYGLWQINMLGSLGTSRRKQFGLKSNEELYTPATNARAMMTISGGGKKWTPWSTYTNGMYLTHVGTANFGVSRAYGESEGTDVVPDILEGDALNNLKKVIETLTDKVTWIRLGLFILGTVLMFVALNKLIGDNKLSNTTKTVASAVVLRKAGGGK